MTDVIDLTGENGILSNAVKKVTIICGERDMDPKPIIHEMLKKDYNHMVSVVENAFRGKVAVLAETR